ncbi:phosphatidylinositol-binding clathrin assembly protein-like [Aquarana catesbeiana]|uniref:phosphatidylinositol-binding clathrin assembly protein-like n=1 Tax=Aquarana catesbeiana TaxID=8400 RepID=UPI003CCA6975
MQPSFQPAVHPLSAVPQVASTWGDPFSSEAGDETISNLNPFLSKPSDGAHLPGISTDTSSFTAKTPNHDIFIDSFCGPQVYPNASHFHSEPSVAGLYGGFTPSLAVQPQTSGGLNVDFDSVFGNKSPSNINVDSTGFDDMGGLLKPTVSSQNTSAPSSKNQPGKLVSDDLDSSLANLVGNLGIGNGTTKNDVHWIQPGEKKLTGGTNWQPKLAPTTTWNPATLAPPIMAYPATTPTGIAAFGMPPQMGSVPQQALIYNQPVMRPPNPFGPVSGAQMQFM